MTDLVDSKAVWQGYGIEMGLVCVFYIILYIILVYKCFEHEMETKYVLYFTNNVGSTIHSIFMVFFFIFFFINQRYKSGLLSKPGMAGHAWVWWDSYMIIDLLLHIIFFAKYSSKELPKRPDLLIHHSVMIIPLFAIQYPDPIYGWPPLHALIGAEISTIFLNLKWFAKMANKLTLKKYLDTGFIITWFFVRLPISFYAFIWMVWYWKDIYNIFPLRQAIFGYLFGTLALIPQLIWTVLLLNKMYKHQKNKKMDPIMAELDQNIKLKDDNDPETQILTKNTK